MDFAHVEVPIAAGERDPGRAERVSAAVPVGDVDARLTFVCAVRRTCPHAGSASRCGDAQHRKQSQRDPCADCHGFLLPTFPTRQPRSASHRLGGHAG
jgi:hypothetical protein